MDCLIVVALAAAFKAGKIQNNPFSQASTSGGAAIPPPSNLAGCCLLRLLFVALSSVVLS